MYNYSLLFLVFESDYFNSILTILILKGGKNVSWSSDHPYIYKLNYPNFAKGWAPSRLYIVKQDCFSCRAISN